MLTICVCASQPALRHVGTSPCVRYIALITPFMLSWIIFKIVPRTSRLHETLQFLLDHPRRCFIYLFPSHQTWFLLTILVFLKCVRPFPPFLSPLSLLASSLYIV